MPAFNDTPEVQAAAIIAAATIIAATEASASRASFGSIDSSDNEKFKSPDQRVADLAQLILNRIVGVLKTPA